jgi:hypothetical protein
MTSGSPSNNPEMLDLAALSALLQLSPATILTQRTRAPDRVPPAWRSRPLRWRRDAVMDWLIKQEREEQRRVEQRTQVVSTRRITR